MLKTGTFATDHNGSEIEYIAENAPEFFEGFSHAWVTCLDSIRGDFTGSPHIKSLIETRRTAARVLPGGLLIDPSGLSLAASELHLFNGFEEVWFVGNTGYPGAIEIIPSPPPVPVSSVVNSRCSRSDIDQMLAWMDRFDISLGVADGLGLEVVTTSPDVYDHLARIYPHEDAQ